MYIYVQKKTHTKAHELIHRHAHVPSGPRMQACGTCTTAVIRETESQKVTHALSIKAHSWTHSPTCEPRAANQHLFYCWAPGPTRHLPNPPPQDTSWEKRSPLLKRHPEGSDSESCHLGLSQWQGPANGLATMWHNDTHRSQCYGVTPDLGTISRYGWISWKLFCLRELGKSLASKVSKDPQTP
jgi:hypothetical protein